MLNLFLAVFLQKFTSFKKVDRQIISVATNVAET